ncbi:DUF4832 domain-containing protein [Promicromonospora sp. NPDC052451]|uniref:DUF4832 domain-containing protein n=1 Tax=Promicromonospora sp. NPDC052451 TaxID=3364407 RepID=UPI0037C6AC85
MSSARTAPRLLAGALALGTAISTALLGAVAVPQPADARPRPHATSTVNLEPTAALADNPLKGFLPFAPEPGQTLDAADPAFPHTLEWFYLPVNAVVTGEDTYDWTRVEAYLDSIAGRGHQSVLRFYLDYPGRPTGVPGYLLGPDGISQERRYDFWDNNGTSFSPDYDDPRVVDLITGFIAALGQRYDGDPRIAYLTAGLVGFWGEDHTYPMNGIVEPTNPDGVDWMPSTATREAIWDAWDAALDETWLQARYPSAAVAGHGFGLHDDSFAYATLPTTDWHFLSQVQAAGMGEAWRTVPIGGELYPPLQTCIFAQPLDCPDAAEEIATGRDYDVAGATAASHATWIINHQAWATGYDADDRPRAIAAAAALGYDLTATQATVTTGGGRTAVSLTLANRGVAPFYGDWPAELAVLDDDGTVLARTAVDADLPSIQPGTSRTLEATLPGGMSGGTLALHVPNVMPGGAPLRFANTTQDADAEGYLTLTTIP